MDRPHLVFDLGIHFLIFLANYLCDWQCGAWRLFRALSEFNPKRQLRIVSISLCCNQNCHHFSDCYIGHHTFHVAQQFFLQSFLSCLKQIWRASEVRLPQHVQPYCLFRALRCAFSSLVRPIRLLRKGADVVTTETWPPARVSYRVSRRTGIVVFWTKDSIRRLIIFLDRCSLRTRHESETRIGIILREAFRFTPISSQVDAWSPC